MRMVLERSETAGRSWDGHLLLHASETERASGLVPWVRRGLANNEKVICGQAQAEPEERSVAAILSRHGIDVAGLLAEGMLAVVPPPELYPRGGQLPVVERALAEGTVRPVLPARPPLPDLPDLAGLYGRRTGS
jgi:hypothetical protein